MALADTLKSLADTSKNNALCKFGKIFMGLDEETREALDSALRSEASTMDISRALNDDGLHIRREFLGEKRRCFNDLATTCCLGPNRDGVCK